MNKQKRSLILVAVTIFAIFWWLKSARFDVVHYQGQTIKLSKAYFDFDQYKNDPDNIAASETARVQTLVAAAPIAHSFADRRYIYGATSEIEFPGYGMGGFTSDPQPDGTELFGVSIEIPRANKERYIIFRGRNGNYEVADDFVYDETPLPSSIREEKGTYIVFDRDGRELFRRPATWRLGG
jgi:hypothetical protein